MRDLRPPTENRIGIKIITTLAIMRGDEDDKTRETVDTDLPQAQLLLCRTLHSLGRVSTGMPRRRSNACSMPLKQHRVEIIILLGENWKT